MRQTSIRQLCTLVCTLAFLGLLSALGFFFTASSKKVIVSTNTSDKNIVQTIIKSLDYTLPQKSLDVILKNPTKFLDEARAVISNTDDLLLLIVDKKNNIGQYLPSTLVDLDDYKDQLNLSRKGLQLHADALPDLLRMVAAAKSDGVVLPISSAYRSYTYQKQVFARHVNRIGETEAARESARAGTSQHQLGLAIDFGSIDNSFAKTDAGKWLFDKAWQYGYSLSYPQGQESITGYRPESWHYRYIGVRTSTFEHNYFNKGQQYTLEILQKIAKITP